MFNDKRRDTMAGIYKEYHPRWIKNLDEMHAYFKNKGLNGKHIAGCKGKLFYFELYEPKRYEYAILYKRNPLKKDRLTSDFIFVFETRKFSVYRREEPLNIFKFDSVDKAKYGDGVLLAKPFSDSQDEEFEQWLSEKAKEGLIFRRDDIQGILFIKRNPENMVYRTDFRVDIPDFSAYLTDITRRGWKYIWSDGSTFYFKKPGLNQNEQLFKNNMSRVEKYQRKADYLKKAEFMLRIILVFGILTVLSAVTMLIFPDGILHGIHGKPNIFRFIGVFVIGILDSAIGFVPLKIFKKERKNIEDKITQLKSL